MKQNIQKALNNPKQTIAIAGGIGLVIAVVVFFTVGRTPEYLYSKAVVGSITTDISGSGTIEAAKPFAFSVPVSGRVESVSVAAGSKVKAGDQVAVIAVDDAQGAAVAASSALKTAQANYAKVSGGNSAEINVARTAVETAQKNLSESTRQQDTLVANAYRTYLSDDIEAVPYSDKGESLPPSVSGSAPIITGSYTGPEGDYKIHLIATGAQSGYSFELSGLETSATIAVDTKTAVPFGTHGLYILFPADFSHSVDWVVSIPNKRSASYSANLNAYQAAQKTRDQIVLAAQSALDQANANFALKLATSRPEDASAALAQLRQAENAYHIATDTHPAFVLTAPVDGTIGALSLQAGEIAVAGTQAGIIAPRDAFALVLSVPAADAERLSLGQAVSMRFDESASTTISARVASIDARGSASEARFVITDGQHVALGDSVDATIAGETAENIIIVPRKAVFLDNGRSTVLVKGAASISERKVDVGLVGSDTVEILSGLSAGEQVVTFSK